MSATGSIDTSSTPTDNLANDGWFGESGDPVLTEEPSTIYEHPTAENQVEYDIEILLCNPRAPNYGEFVEKYPGHDRA